MFVHSHNSDAFKVTATVWTGHSATVLKLSEAVICIAIRSLLKFSRMAQDKLPDKKLHCGKQCKAINRLYRSHSLGAGRTCIL